jgi:S-adenosylmethionine/arginine decarboxylase-like enzyme
MVFGSHLILDTSGCNDNITNIDVINEFINKLCIIGNMKRKGKLIVEEFEDNDFNRTNDLVGYSIVQIISLSNITLHINFISRTMYMDFFTCGELYPNKIIDLVKHYFECNTYKKIIIYRDAKEPNNLILV